MENKTLALADMKIGQTEIFASEFCADLPQEVLMDYEALSTAEQDRYQAFFKEKLDKYGVKSPADLDEAKKKQFFEEVKKDWK
jgi:hypothetical protein